jgi:hypothetical protein
MERYRAAQGSNDSYSTMHALAAGPAGKLQFISLFLPFVFHMAGVDDGRFRVNHLPGNGLFFFLFHGIPPLFRL